MKSLLRRLKKLIPERSPVRLSWHYARAFCAAARYGFPARKLTVIGITGTDGKTTTVTMTAHILRHAGRKTGLISTTAFHIGDQIELNVTQKTSMSPFILQQQLRRMADAGCEFAVIEVSSHGLVQGRVNHIFPSVAGITNTAEEHLDYHKTMTQYRRDKGKLFEMLRGKPAFALLRGATCLSGRQAAGRGTKVLNGEDETCKMYEPIPSADTIIYNSKESDLWVTDIVNSQNGCSAVLHTDLGGTAKLTLAIPGIFNIENALCAIGCSLGVGIPLDLCLDALQTFSGVEGRLQEINEGQTFRVFVDFTVTPQAYEKVLTTLKAMVPSGKRILVMMGSCGNRMSEKRPQLGKICSDLADVVILTSDETYGEPHEKIIDEIWAAVDQSHAMAFKVPDRKEAIMFTLAQAQEGDIVLLAGMAGVTTMMTAEGQVPWDEESIAREVLRSL